MVVWVRGKVRTFHWYSLKVMRLIILYSAVYQLRVASPAHVNEITMPTCRAHTHTHTLSVPSSSEASGSSLTATDLAWQIDLIFQPLPPGPQHPCSSCVFQYLILHLLWLKRAPTLVEVNTKPVATEPAALFIVVWCAIMQLLFTTCL